MIDLLTVKTYGTRAEADTAKTLLDSQKIEALVISDDAGGVDPILANVNGVQLKVGKTDLEKAKKLLNIQS